MVQISLQKVSRSFGSEVIFSDVTAKIEDHDRIGLVGPNGTGKTTLLRVICGELEPDDGSGEIARGADLSIGYQKQNCGLSFEGTIWQEMQSVFADVYALERRMKELQERMAQENTPALAEEYRRTEDAFLARDGYQIEVKIKTVLTGMGFAEHGFDKCVDKLSGGEQTRLAIAKLLLEAPSLLILDEPTNHLDFATLSWLEDYLASYKGALLVVSHDRYFLDKLCNKIWELEDGTLWEYKGNYTAYTRQREEQDTRQKKLYEQQQAERAKLEDYVARNLVRASTTKMAQSRRRQLEKLEITEAPQAEAHQLNFRFEYDIEPYDELVIMKGLTIRIGERTLLEALDYVVHRGDKLIIAGPNGTGKSTLLQVLDGKRRPSGGMVRLGTGAKPGIFVQQQARRAGRVIDAIWNQYPRFTELEVRSHLARFGYRGEEVFKDCATLSGGEMARLRFAELALERPNLMFLDEPTNHLDIFMRETLTDALSAYTGTLLLVTHDRYLMQTLGCPILYLEDGKATFYQNFQKLHDRDTSKQPEPAKQEDKPQKAGYGKEQRRRRAEVRTRLKALETEIEELGAHIVELENEINDPEVLRDHLLLRDKCDELDDSRFHQQELYDEWEKLAEEQDRMDAESDS